MFIFYSASNKIISSFDIEDDDEDGAAAAVQSSVTQQTVCFETDAIANDNNGTCKYSHNYYRTNKFVL